MLLEALEERVVPAGTWTPLTSSAPSDIGTMLLLPNGTVMAQEGGNANWDLLTPDASGSYINGTWSSLAAMSENRLYYGSVVMPNDKVFVLGGEYSGSSLSQTFDNTGEIYNPATNTWSAIKNFPQSNFGDDPAELLSNGQILLGYLFGPQTYRYDPSTNKYQQTAGNKLHNDASDEESWVKLSDGSILSYDIFNSNGSTPGTAQRYIPAQDKWVDATGNGVPVVLTNSSTYGDELGPALLLPDGRALFIGANNNTALYTPSTNSWAAGPKLPAGMGADDAPGAELPDGNVLFCADTPLFNGPTEIFEYNYQNSSISQISTPSTLTSQLSSAAYTDRMLVLPTGQVLLTTGFGDLWVYTPSDPAPASSQPVITGISNNGSNFTLTGTQLTGMSEGAAYGDDAQMASNYPIISVTDDQGNVTYSETSNWSSAWVQTGITPETTDFTAVNGGAYLLSVSAAGISSSDLLFVELQANVSDNVTLTLDPNDTSNIQVFQGGTSGTLLGEFPLSSFTAIDINGSGAVTLDYSNGHFGLPITDTATGGANDSLTIAHSGTNFLSRLEYDATGQGSGIVKVTNNPNDPLDTISFSGVTSLIETANAGKMVISIDPNDAIAGRISTSFTAGSSAGTNVMAIDNGLLGMIFANPAYLRVNGHTGADTITFSSLDSGFHCPIEIEGTTTANAYANDDVVNVNTALQLGPEQVGGGSVFVFAGTTSIGANIDGTFGSPGEVTFLGNVLMNANATIKYGGNSPGLEIDGKLNLQGYTLTTVDSATTDTGEIVYPITGSGGALTKSGPGTLILDSNGSNVSNYSGATTISAGTLQVDGTITSNVTLNGGILDGTGTTGSVSGSSGTLAPGDSGAPGILTTGGLDLTKGSAASFQIGGNTAGSASNNYAQDVVASGTITLGATLNLYSFNKFKPANNDEYILVNNQAGNAISTSFVAGAGIDNVAAGTTLKQGTILSYNFLGSGFVAYIVYNANNNNSVAIMVTVAPQLGALSPTAWTVNQPYSATISVTGNSPFSNLTASGLPAGLSASLSGSTITISGTPTATGTFSNIRIGVTDVIGAATTDTYALVINRAPTLGSLTQTQWTVSQAGFPGALAISNGTSPFTISAQSGLPTGLTATLSGTKVIFTGTPSVASSFPSGSVTIQDAAGATATANFSITINALPTIGSLTQTQWTVNRPGFTGTFPISNGTASFTITAQSNLPNGLTAVLSGTTISFTGTPTVAGTFSSGSITIKDAAGATATTAPFVITINTAPTIGALTANQWTVNQSGFTGTLPISNGTSAFTITAQSGLPAGLTAVVSGTTISFTGTPTTVAAYPNGSVTIKDLAGATASATFSITIAATPTIGALTQTQWTVGQAAFTGTLPISNGTAPFSLTSQSGLPAGLTAVVSGTTISFTGTPTTAAVYPNGSISIKDTAGATATATFSITINSAPTVGTISITQWTVNRSFPATLTITNGTAPFAVSSSSGLPTGLTATVSGNTVIFTGTPTTASMFASGSVTIKDAAGALASSPTFSVTINATPVLSAPTVTQWTAGETGFSSTLSISNGTAAFHLGTVAGLPPGVTAALSGTTVSLTGTPTTAAVYAAGSITVLDAAGAAATRTFTITINPGMRFNPPVLAPGIVGVPYSQAVGAVGGTGAVTLTYPAIANPLGLTLTPSPAISPITLSGTPSATGSFSFTVTATDAVGAKASFSYTVSVVSIALVPDFLTPGLTMLVVGAPAHDTGGTTIQRVDAAGDLSVFVQGSSTPAAIQNGSGPGQTLARPTGHILVYANGTDTIHLKAGPVTAPVPIGVPAFLVGGNGNDTLDATGSNANNVLAGGNGSNVLRGGSGRNILIGGPDYGVLYGGAQDVLLSGTVNYALNYSGGVTNIAALNALMAEWGDPTRSIATRETNLQKGGGANGANVLSPLTVQTDVPAEMIVPGSTQNWIINSPLLIGTQESAGNLTFSWGTVNGAASYQLLLVDVTTGSTVSTTSVSAAAAQVQTYTRPTSGLLAGHSYRWYITPLTATNGLGLKSNPLTFVLT